MSRSRRKTPIVGHTTCGSEREADIFHGLCRLRAEIAPADQFTVGVRRDLARDVNGAPARGHDYRHLSVIIEKCTD